MLIFKDFFAKNKEAFHHLHYKIIQECEGLSEEIVKTRVFWEFSNTCYAIFRLYKSTNVSSLNVSNIDLFTCLYSQHFFPERTHQSKSEYNFYFKNLYSSLQSDVYYLSEEKQSNIVDVGCGIAHIGTILSNLRFVQKYYGIDRDTLMIEVIDITLDYSTTTKIKLN